MQAMAIALDGMATVFKLKNLFDPLNRNPKEEPFKRYIYDKDNPESGDIPYRTEWPSKIPAKTRMAMQAEAVKARILGQAVKGVRFSQWRKSDPEIDDYLITKISGQVFSVGF